MGNYRDTYFEKNKGNYGWYTCQKCGKKLRKGDTDIDHIIPQKYGGGHNEFNLQCLCVHCNRSKGADVDDIIPDRINSAKRIIGRNINDKKSSVNDFFKRFK